MNKFIYLYIVLVCIHFAKAQDTNSTTELTTEEPDANATTVAPTEPPLPLPERGSWNVSENNATCIRADLRIRLIIPVENTTDYILLSPNATTGGSQCTAADGTQTLKLNQDEDQMTLSFMFEKDNMNRVSLKSVTLNVRRTGQAESFFSTNSSLFHVEGGHSFLCKSPLVVDLQTAKMEIFYIQVQAFGVPDKYYGIPEECPEDDNVNDVVPIVVACALAALIVIVLIAYLVGRRRSRAKGYNSV